MGVITKQQAFAVLKGMRLFSTSTGVTSLVSTRFPGIKWNDLYNPSGIDLVNAALLTYPYVPGSGDPALQTFSNVEGLDTIQDGTTGGTVFIIREGGNINTNVTLQPFERDYHKTGTKLQKKLK